MGLRDVRKLLRLPAAHPAAGDAKPSNFDAQTATTTRLFSRLKLRRQKHEKLGKKVQSQLPPDEVLCRGTESEIEEPSREQQQGQRQSTTKPTKDDAKCPAVHTSTDDGLPHKPSLWDRAYDTLRKDNVQLLEEYEALISREVQLSGPVSDNVYGPESQRSLEPAGHLPHGSQRLRRIQLDKIIDRGLRKTEENGTGCVYSALGGTAEFLRSIKGFITQAVSASPEASVAWAAVCLLLPLLTNHVDAEEANREGFTYTVHRMEYCCALEPLVFERNDHLNPALRVAMEKRFETLYSALLEFQIRTVLRFHERTAKTFVKETFNPNAWKELRANIDKAEVVLNQDLEHVTASALLLEAKNRNELSKQHAADLQKLLIPLGDTATKIANMTEKHLQAGQAILTAVTEQSRFQQAEAQRKDEQKMSDEEMKCLQRLRLTDTDTYEVTKDRVDAHVEGTCQWVVRQQSFCQWMEQNSGPLLITADPGCGKSVLTKYLVDHHLPRESATICYFFFKEPHQTRTSQALCAILHQLFVSQPIMLKKYAMDQLLRDPDGLVNTPSKLWEIFWQIVCDPEAGSIIVVMDALDECDPSDLKDFLVPDLRKNMAKSINAKFLFTTRPYDPITLQFDRLEDVVPSYVRILGEDKCEDISREVNLVIEHRVEEFAKDKRLHVELKKKLRDILLEIEHRTYLWVALLFDELRYQSFKKTADGIESAIKTLPTTVNEAYEKLLSRSTEHSTVRRALSFIIAAKQPLTVAEMKIALNARAGILPTDDHESEEDFKERLRQLCGLFISFYKDTVYFFHQTAREFLLPHRQAEDSVLVSPNHVDTQWRSSFSVPQANAELARACVQYLYMLSRDGFFGFGGKKFNVDRCRFYWYSRLSWLRHYRLSNGTLDAHAEFATAALLICDPQTPGFWEFSTWTDSSYRDRVREYLTPLRVASITGCNAVVKHLLATGVDMEIEQHGGDSVWPAVQFAAEWGFFDTALLLLNHLPPNAAERMGAQPMRNSLFGPPRNPIVLSRHYGPNQSYELMLLDLLNNGFLNQPWKEGWVGSSLLDGLVANGYIDYARLVLQKYGGHTIEQQLQDIGFAILETLKPSRQDPAVKQNIVQMLLDYGDGIVEANRAKSNKSLPAVGCGGSHAMLQVRKFGSTALHVAVSTPLISLELVQLLVNRGACIEAVDCKGKTALHRLLEGVSLGDHFATRVAMARFLLDRGANANAMDSNGWTVLHQAVQDSSAAGVEIVQPLLDSGADLTAVDDYGRTAFHCAVQKDRHELARLLLENGAELECSDNSGRTALHMASRCGYKDTISMLIDRGANIEATDEHGWTAIHAASCSADIHILDMGGVIRVLLDSGANIEARDNHGMTPLHATVSKGYPDVADLLIDSGADVNVILEAFDAIVTHIVTVWLKITMQSDKRVTSSRSYSRWLRSLLWCFQKAALIQSPSIGFQALLDQFVSYHEHELIDLLHHYDHIMLPRKLYIIRQARRSEYLRTYELLFEFFAEHGVNVAVVEEVTWKKYGVIVPISWLYDEDTM